MKVCLVEPPKYVSLSNFVSTIAMPPIGTAYIAAVIDKAGHDLTVIDAHGLALNHYFNFKKMRVRGLEPDQVVSQIPSDTQAIAIGSMFSAHWPLIRTILERIREKFPEALLIHGGEHGTGFPEFSLEQSPIDVVVMGEGEETIVELLKAYENGQNLAAVAGIAYRDGDSIQTNPRRARLREIDELPLPAWHYFPIEEYLQINQPHGAAQGRFMPMLATRGCPFSCTFCTSPNMWTNLWLPRDPRKVVDEMELYIQKYNVTDFQFEDLTAIVRKDWIETFCQEIVDRKLKITFQLPSGTRSEVIDYDLALKMKAAGCHDFAFAPESGDERILKAIKKESRLPAVFKAAQDAMRAGISVGCFFIIGFPEDDWRSVWRTYKAIVKCSWLGFANANINAYSPQPNSESFRELVRNGVIKDLDDDYFMSLYSFQDFGRIKKSYNPKFSNFVLTLLVFFGALIFYIVYFIRRPQRIWFLIRDMFSRKAENKTSKVAKALFGDMKRILLQKFKK
jgi:radical SAM superfamily enzyme YgiQ (UPF0313 family)